MSGVLGVSTVGYLPFCFFNLLSPVLDVIYGFVGFKVAQGPPPADADAPDGANATPMRASPPEEEDVSGSQRSA
jgi:NhaC family Na+:H+ antiporter